MEVAPPPYDPQQLDRRRHSRPRLVDYEIGFDAEFRFTDKSRYGALQRDSDQAQAIETYQKQARLKVYYQLYNPWSVPFVQRVPLAGYIPPVGTPELGVRVIPSSVVHATMSGLSERSPALHDLADVPPLPGYGLAARAVHL